MGAKTTSNKEITEVKETIKKLPLEQKLEILTALEEELFAVRFKSLLEGFRETAQMYPLTLDEITREVEIIRQKLYESGN